MTYRDISKHQWWIGIFKKERKKKYTKSVFQHKQIISRKVQRFSLQFGRIQEKFLTSLLSATVAIIASVSWIQWHINLCGLPNARAINAEEQQWYYLTRSWGDGKGVPTFFKGISPKVNVTRCLNSTCTVSYYECPLSLSLYIYIYTYTHTHVNVYVCVCVYIYIYTHTNEYTYKHTHIYI